MEMSNINTEAFADVLNCSKTFLGLESQYQREQTFSSKFGLLKPQKIVLGKSSKWASKKGTSKVIEFEEEGYYFNFIASLKRLMVHEGFKKALQPALDFENVMKDISHGSFYKNHEILSDNTAIAIIAYYDDVEVANPLGSKTKKHKLGVFYWFIGNINPAYRSQLTAINVLAIAKTKYIRKYGTKLLLQNFLEGLNELKNGIVIDGFEYPIKGALVAFPSDTLASNFIGGFKESPSFSYRPCRFCNITKLNLKSTFSENQISLRNSISHSEQLEQILDSNLSEPAQKYWSKMYGIVGRSTLSEAPYFDLTKCFVIDIMHILFEGVVLHEIKLFLNFCIDNKYFKLSTFNSEMQTFRFIGTTNTDLPTPIDINVLKDKKRKLNQNAAQSWQLLLTLPFLIEKYIPINNEHFENFLDLIKIVNLCVSFEIKKEDVLLLEKLIEIHLTIFSKLYGADLIIPKMHYMLHLPSQIFMFGPSRHLWCFRLEAKHFRLKQSIVLSRNFKNVSLTAAKRLESLACLELTTSNEYLVKDVAITGKKNKVQSLPPYVNIILSDDIFEVSSVVTGNISYKKGFFLLYSINDFEFPVFARIQHIYSIKKEIKLVIQLQETEMYNHRLNAQVVNKTSKNLVLSPKSLNFKHPVFARQYGNKILVIARHYNCIEINYL